MVEDIAIVVEVGAGTMEDDVAVGGSDCADVESAIVDVEEEVFCWAELNEGVDLCHVGEVGITLIDVSDLDCIVVIEHLCFSLVAVKHPADFNNNTPSEEMKGVVLNATT